MIIFGCNYYSIEIFYYHHDDLLVDHFLNSLTYDWIFDYLAQQEYKTNSGEKCSYNV